MGIMTGDADVTLSARVAAAGARTVATGTARVFAASCTGSPVPQPGDRRCDGVADFAQRRTEVTGPLVPERLAPEGLGDDVDRLTDDDPAMYAVVRSFIDPHRRTVYDGAHELWHSGDQWIGSLGDNDGPRGHNDPLWPLDTLFGVNDDVVEVAHEPVRDTDTVRCRLTVDLLRADERLPAGMSVPEGPLRRLRRIPAEVWLDDLGLARRIAVAPGVSNVRKDRESWIWHVTELWDFGVGVTIPPPPIDEVIAIDEVVWENTGSSANKRRG